MYAVPYCDADAIELVDDLPFKILKINYMPHVYLAGYTHASGDIAPTFTGSFKTDKVHLLHGYDAATAIRDVLESVTGLVFEVLPVWSGLKSCWYAFTFVSDSATFDKMCPNG